MVSVKEIVTGPPVPSREVRPGRVIASMCLAVVLIIASVSSLNVALVNIGRSLDASQSDVQWIVDIFALVLAALLLPAGALGDKFGRKRVMVAGLAVFVAAGLWATVAGTVPSLLGARALGGLGAALIFPATLSTLTGSLPSDQRARGIGLWAASAALGGTLGSVGAGALLEEFWYGSIFLVLALVAAVVGLMTLLFVPETSDPEDANLDPVGAVLSFVGIGGLVLAITEGPIKGWTDTLTLVGLGAAIAGLVGFALYELRIARPMLDVRLFQNREFRVGSISIFLQFVAAFGFFFTGSQYLAFVRGYSPLEVGLAFLPMAPFVPITATRAPVWARKVGRGRVGGAGLALMALGFAIFALLDGGSSYWLFAAGLIFFGSGMGLASTPATEAIIGALPLAKQGVASAVNDVSRELGGALGIAVLGSALTSGYRSSIESAAETLPGGALPVIRDTAAGGLEVAASAGRGADGIRDTIQASVVDGFAASMWMGCAVLVAGALYVTLRAPRASVADDSPAVDLQPDTTAGTSSRALEPAYASPTSRRNT